MGEKKRRISPVAREAGRLVGRANPGGASVRRAPAIPTGTFHAARARLGSPPRGEWQEFTASGYPETEGR